jgi:hypothetical protein
MLRAIALENNLDPDTTLPEDLMLLAKNDKGELLVKQELEQAEKRAEYYRNANRLD